MEGRSEAQWQIKREAEASLSKLCYCREKFIEMQTSLFRTVHLCNRREIRLFGGEHVTTEFQL